MSVRHGRITSPTPFTLEEASGLKQIILVVAVLDIILGLSIFLVDWSAKIKEPPTPTPEQKLEIVKKQKEPRSAERGSYFL